MCVCVDINECSMLNEPCGANATCTNTEGSFNCTCDLGYEPFNSTNFTSCTGLYSYRRHKNIVLLILQFPLDINECSSQFDNCDGILATCWNTDGSFVCMCNLGYTGNGTIGNCEGTYVYIIFV